MDDPRIRIFISAASADLRTVRALVAEQMRRMWCDPVDQAIFVVDHRTLHEKLQNRLEQCHAMVHLAGLRYGAEPRQRAEEEPRRSYTQLEYHLGRQLQENAGQLRCYTFVLPVDFEYDRNDELGNALAPEDPDLRQLQDGHRELLLTSGYDRGKPRSREELRVLVCELCSHLRRELGLRNPAHRAAPRIRPEGAEGFVGRDEEVTQVVQHLRTHDRVALIGPGGIGKTALAARAVENLVPPGEEHAMFPAGTFVHDFYRLPSHNLACRALLRMAGLDDVRDEELDAVLARYFSDHRAFIYFEGCERAENLARMLAIVHQAKVLLTSRRGRDARNARRHRVGRLNLPEAVRLLCSSAGCGDDSASPDPAWENLARLLGCHALALSLAGAAIQCSGSTPLEFQGEFKACKLRVLEENCEKRSFPALIRHIAEAVDPGARDPWVVLALNTFDAIPVNSIAEVLEIERHTAVQALRELGDHSIAEAEADAEPRREGEESRWQLVHVLLGDFALEILEKVGARVAWIREQWTRFHQNEAENQTARDTRKEDFSFFAPVAYADAQGMPVFTSAADEYLAGLLSERSIQKMAVLDQLFLPAEPVERITQPRSAQLSRTDDSAEVRHSAIRWAQAALEDRGLIAEAPENLPEEPSDEEAKSSLTSKKPNPAGIFLEELEQAEARIARLRLRQQLAIMLSAEGRFAEAEAQQRTILAEQQSEAAESEGAFQTWNELADTLYVQSQFSEAAEEYRRIIHSYSQRLGNQSAEMLATRNRFARALFAQGEYRKAQIEAKRVHDDTEKLFRKSPDHPARIDSLFNLAIATAPRSKTKALDLGQRALEAARRVHGADHPVTRDIRRFVQTIGFAIFEEQD